jgi:hypothetical protein
MDGPDRFTQGSVTRPQPKNSVWASLDRFPAASPGWSTALAEVAEAVNDAVG